MRYEEPKMNISMFDDEDDILTASTAATFGLDEGSSTASDAARSDSDGASTYSIDVKTFN